jgi:hypothetical protein
MPPDESLALRAVNNKCENTYGRINTNKIDAAKVLNEVDFIVPFVCVIAYEASVSRSNGSSGADRDPEAWQTYRNLDQRDAHQARGKS